MSYPVAACNMSDNTSQTSCDYETWYVVRRQSRRSQYIRSYLKFALRKTLV
jgi:hypothetical protein